MMASATRSGFAAQRTQTPIGAVGRSTGCVAAEGDCSDVKSARAGRIIIEGSSQLANVRASARAVAPN